MSSTRANHEPIALVGIGCRLPGGVDSPTAFWRLLSERKTNVGQISPDRLPVDDLYSGAEATPGHMITRHGAFFDGPEIDSFDNTFFGISPREARKLDPQQRMLLEVGWEALEDAGIPPSSVHGTTAGVYMGVWTSDFETRLFRRGNDLDLYAATGSGRYAASGRLSYVLGCTGPSMTIDTACSSSLVAVHLACMAIRAGECDIALAGGVNLMLVPHITVAFSQAGMMAPDGKCKFGDARADGYVRSEGLGIVVLKRLSAVAPTDRVYATIDGSATNNDGQTGKYFVAPGSDGQLALLRAAWDRAGVGGESFGYIEAHGTGTAAGDRIELGALGEALSQDRDSIDPCPVGSVKTNIGHLEAAAGVSGLIKAALVQHEKTIPASLHFESANPAVPWDRIPVELVTEARPLDRVRTHVGVTAFGISGTNAHVVVGPAPAAATAVPGPPETPLTIPMSARTPGALVETAQSWGDWLRGGGVALEDAARTATLHREHHPYRMAVVAADVPDLIAHLDAFAMARDSPPAHAGRVVPGAAAQALWFVPARMRRWDDDTFRRMASLDTWASDATVIAAAGRAVGMDIFDDDGVLVAALPETIVTFVQGALWAARLEAAGARPTAIASLTSGSPLAGWIAGRCALDVATLAAIDETAVDPAPSSTGRGTDLLAAADMATLRGLIEKHTEGAAPWIALGIGGEPLPDLGPPAPIVDPNPLTGPAEQVAACHVHGVLVSWPDIGAFVPAPTYRWQRTVAWFDLDGPGYRVDAATADGDSMFGGRLPQLAHRPEERVWARRWPTDALRDLLADRQRIADSIAAESESDDGKGRIVEVHTSIPGVVGLTDRTEAQLIISDGTDSSFSFHVRTADGSWAEGASGSARPIKARPDAGSVVDLLTEIAPHRRKRWIEDRIIGELSLVDGAVEAAPITTDTTLIELDRALGGGVRRRLEAISGADVTDQQLVDHPSVAALASHWATTLVPGPETDDRKSKTAADAMAARLEQLLSSNRSSR